MTRRTPRRRWPFVLLTIFVVLVVAAGGAAYALGWAGRWLGTDKPATPPMPALSMRPVTAATGQVAAPATTGRLRPAAVRRALAGLLGDAALGRHVLAEVSPLSGAPVLAKGSGAATPASVTKLLTTTAALSSLGAQHRFTTTVTRAGGRLTLVGGGDPLLSSDDLDELAAHTATALRKAGVSRVRLAYDAGLFVGPSIDPHWPQTYIPEEVVAPISALTVDEAHTPGPDGQLGTADDGRELRPADEAARAFAADLRKAGVTVAGTPAKGATQGAEIASVEGRTVAEIVEHTLQLSDNEAAEILLRHVGEKAGDASFTGGVRAVERTLTGLGVDASGLTMYDGSGLSREDRLTPAALTGVLQLAASSHHPELSAVLSGLPVAGFSGSLADRFEGDATHGRGLVRAKTGTLTGVSALAGLVTDQRGTPMVVVVMADRIAPTDTLDARAALDDALAALATCACS